MGQAKNRKEEIAVLKALGARFKWADLRPEYVSRIKQAQAEYEEKLSEYADRLDTATPEEAMSFMKECDNQRLEFAIRVGCGIVKNKIASVEQVKDAAWEGFNGLLEACCVEQNIQINLNLPVSQINSDDFIITGPDALEKAVARGWVKA